MSSLSAEHLVLDDGSGKVLVDVSWLAQKGYPPSVPLGAYVMVAGYCEAADEVTSVLCMWGVSPLSS